MSEDVTKKEVEKEVEDVVVDPKTILINEKKELEADYKKLAQKKQYLSSEVAKVDEDLLKKMGAYQTLTKLLEKFAPKKEDKVPEVTPPADDNKEEPKKEEPGVETEVDQVNEEVEDAELVEEPEKEEVEAPVEEAKEE